MSSSQGLMSNLFRKYVSKLKTERGERCLRPVPSENAILTHKVQAMGKSRCSCGIGGRNIMVRWPFCP